MEDERVVAARNILRRHLDAAEQPSPLKAKIARLLSIQNPREVDVEEAVQAIYQTLEVDHLREIVRRYDNQLTLIDDKAAGALAALAAGDTNEVRRILLRILTLSVMQGGGSN